MQAVLDKNADRLGDRTAVLLHNSARMMPLQKACLVFSKHPNDKTGGRIISTARALLRGLEQSNVNKVLISSEMLSGPVPSFHRVGSLGDSAIQIAPYLRCAFEEHDTNFCVYTRNQDRWLGSLHAHLLRSRGLKMAKSDFIARASENNFSIKDLADQTIASLGKGVALRMEDDIGTRLGPGTGFFQLAGYDDDQLSAWYSTSPENVGLSASVVSRMDSTLWLAAPPLLRKFVARWLNKRA